jgi:uncharacterized membrane protein
MDPVPDILIFFGRFHSLVVHLPLGFLVLAILLELIIRFRNQHQFRPLVKFIWLLSTISGLLSVLMGLALAAGGGYDEVTLDRHKFSGIALVIISAACYVLSSSRIPLAEKTLGILYSSFVLLAVISIVITGHLGGSLTHGSNYLVEYAPASLGDITATSKGNRNVKRRIESLDSVDIFNDAVMPIIQANCASCHNKDKKKGKLLLTSYEAILAGGETREGVVPGNTATSELFRRITLPDDHKDFMPANGKKPLTEAEVAIIQWWIQTGAQPTALVPELHPSKKMQAVLEDFFQIGRDEILDLVVPVASIDAIRKLLKDGFSVNQLTPTQNLYEVKFSGKYKQSPDYNSLLGLKQQIVWLQLIDCGITDEQLKTIAKLPNLYKLNLSRNPISDTGVQQLLALPKLKMLNLYGTQITDSGVRALAAMPSLKNLYVWQTKVDTLRMDSFKLPRKDLEIVYELNGR